MNYNLFLDDYRNPNKFLHDVRVWEIVKNHKEFVRIIERRGLPQFISFDHDIADEHYTAKDYGTYTEKTGYDCAKWLVEFCMKTNQPLPEYQVHSMNPVGRKNIQTLLDNYKNKIENTDSN